MCLWAYYYFVACEHFGVECSGFCRESCWNAGLTGELECCRPKILDRSLEWSGEETHEPPQPTEWMGIKGSCRECVRDFSLPPTLYQKSYTTHTLPESSHPKLLDPHSLAPYVYLESLVETIPELFGVEDYFKSTQRKEGPAVVFPKRLERTDWVSLRESLPIVSRGFWESGTTGNPSLRDVLNRLGLSEGITPRDGELILMTHRDCSGNTPRMARLFQDSFSNRGMLHQQYLHIVQSLTRSYTMQRLKHAAAQSQLPAQPAAMNRIVAQQQASFHYGQTTPVQRPLSENYIQFIPMSMQSTDYGMWKPANSFGWRTA